MSQHPDKFDPREGEILPPEREETAFGRIFYSSGQGNVKIIKLGPFTGALLALGVGVLMAAVFMFLSGMLAILIPVFVVGGLAAYLGARFGLFGRQPR